MIGLFEPFTEFSLATVGVWYVVTTIAMIALAVIFHYAGIGDVDLSDWGNMKLILVAAIGGPIMEELVFRGIPMYLDGGLTAILFGSLIWTMLHDERAFIVAVSVPLYVKLWLGGFWLEAMFVHMFHNSMLVALLLVKRGIEEHVDGVDTEAIDKGLAQQHE